MKPGSLSHAVGSAMGARIAMAVLNYGLFWSLSHRLQTATLGGFSLLMNVFYMTAMLPLLGLSPSLTRRVATEREHVGIEASNALVFAMPVALVIALAIAGVGLAGYGPALRAPFLLLALSLLPTASTLVSESTLLGLERVADIARFQFAEALLRVTLTIGAVVAGYGLVGVFAVFLALRCGMAVAYRFHPLLPALRRRDLSAAVQRRNWREVPVFLGIGLLAAVTARVDIIVLSRLAGLHEVGVYAAAARLYEASLMLPTIAALSLMPTLARLFADDREYFRRVLAVTMRASLGVGVAVALAVAALAQPIVDLLYRPEVAGAGPVLRMWRGVLLWASRFWQIESLYRANAKYQPEWVPRYLVFRSSGDLPWVATAALRAEAFLVMPTLGRRVRAAEEPAAVPSTPAASPATTGATAAHQATAHTDEVTLDA